MASKKATKSEPIVKVIDTSYANIKFSDIKKNDDEVKTFSREEELRELVKLNPSKKRTRPIFKATNLKG